MIDKVDQIIFLLQSPIIEKYINLLCQFCNIYEFQAIQCMRLYQNLDKIDTKNAQQEKWEIIFNLLNGKYLNEDKIIDNLQLEIIWLLQSKLTNDNIREFAHIYGLEMYNEIIPYLVLEYQTAEEKERSLLKQGLDGSIWTNKKLEIVSTLTEVAMKKILEKDTQPKM